MVGVSFDMTEVLKMVKSLWEPTDKVTIQNIGAVYYGAEVDPTTGDLLVNFSLCIDLVNTSTNRAEEVAYSLRTVQPSPLGETRRKGGVVESMIFDTLENQSSFEPFFLQTDFSDYMWLSTDHPEWEGGSKFLDTAPFSWDTELQLKVTSSSHNGDSKTWPVLTFLMEWMRENEGRTIRELESGMMAPWEREMPSEEQMELVFGEDLTLPPS